jgi:putative ABC transport system ATP-binding protein
MTSNPPPSLELVGVTRRFGDVVALDDLSLHLIPGEMVAVMGPSGTGKSTLVHVAAGIEAPDAGTVHIDGQAVAAADRHAWAAIRRRRLGVVFQRLNLVPSMTAVENVMVPLELDGMARRAARTEARAALADCSVSDVADRYPHQLSGGQQQRVAIARALVGPRSIVLADEPTGALDTANQTAVVELLADRAAAGAAVLLVTHDSRLAAWADRVLLLDDGAIGDEVRAAEDDTQPVGCVMGDDAG